MSVYRDRCRRAQEVMIALGLDYVLVGISADLLYLTGYPARPSERLTLLVIPQRATPAMVMPEFEALRLRQEGYDIFYEAVPWGETGDPIALARSLIDAGIRRPRVGVSEQLWSGFLMKLQQALPHTQFVTAAEVLTPLRMIKDDEGILALMEIGRRMDRVFARVCRLKFELRTEQEVGEDIFQIVREEGLRPTRAGGVASGPNGASPHHRSGDRVIQAGEGVWLELGQGGSYKGYMADMTRCVFVGPPTAEYRRVHAVVREAQQVAFEAVRPGVECQAVDRAGRQVIHEAGYGEYFIHRIGHGLGLETHEPPYLVEGNREVLEAGMVVSDEPGIYLPGQFGIRIEDIVIVTPDMGQRIYQSGHDIVQVQ